MEPRPFKQGQSANKGLGQCSGKSWAKELKIKRTVDLGGQGLLTGDSRSQGLGLGPKGATTRMLSSKQITEVVGTWRNSGTEKAELGGS